jgi:hypothetical protein
VVPDTLEFQSGQRSGRKPTLDRSNRFGTRGNGIGQFVYQARCTRGVSNQQGDPAFLRKLANGSHQGVAACVVETIRDFHMIRVELIIYLQKPQCLLGADCAGAQHLIDHDPVLTEIVADLLRIAFTLRGKSPLAIPAARTYVLGLSMAKYEQCASLVHSRSVKVQQRRTKRCCVPGP